MPILEVKNIRYAYGKHAVLRRVSVHQAGRCVVVVTHSNELAKKADTIFHLRRGQLQKSAPDTNYSAKMQGQKKEK